MWEQRKSFFSQARTFIQIKKTNAVHATTEHTPRELYINNKWLDFSEISFRPGECRRIRPFAFHCIWTVACFCAFVHRSIRIGKKNTNCLSLTRLANCQCTVKACMTATTITGKRNAPGPSTNDYCAKCVTASGADMCCAANDTSIVIVSTTYTHLHTAYCIASTYMH